MLSAMRRLRGRTSAELRERAAQSAAAWFERFSADGAGEGLGEQTLGRALAPGAARDPEQLLADFRARVSSGAFLSPFADPQATVAALRQQLPRDEAEVLARAERIHRKRFDLLGYQALDFGDPVDWHYDPVSGRRAPREHWSRVPYLDADVVGDHKVIWELNRHQYFVTLGQAYWYSGDERHARCFAQHVAEWLAQNPPKMGINWASSLEVSFRAMSWLWALHFFAHSSALTAPLFTQMLAVLDVHGRHVERYLSTYFSPNTHLTGEALGLLHLGALLPELGRAQRWRRLGVRILEDQLRRQVRPDGVYFEQATQYHRYTAEFCLHLLLLAERQQAAVAPHVSDVTAALFRHLLQLTRGDGTIPLFGDDDGGRLLQLDDRPPHDVRGLLALGGAYLDDADLRFGGRGDLAQVGWVLGAEALTREAAAAPVSPSERSRGFPDGGYYVMRDGWGPRDAHLVVDCGPHGTMNGGHAHADALSVELWAQGRQLVADPGTFSYFGAERDAFRSGSAHNGVTVGGRSSTEPGPTPFTWATWADAVPERWAAGRYVDVLRGRIEGWSTQHLVAHRREVLFVRQSYVVLHDRVFGAGEDVEIALQLGPGLSAHMDAARAVRVSDGASKDRERMRIVFHDPGELWIGQGYVSPRYGARVSAPRVRCRVAVEQPEERPVEMVTFLLLPAVDGEFPLVSPVPCTNGVAFRITGAAVDDVLLLGAGHAGIAAAGVDSDGGLTWVRRRSDGAVVVAALDASSILVDGRRCVAASEPFAFHEREC